ncbi:hypothetical protein CERSUDRAFT_110003 [Gelatoporia subvermispora B]|uniref:Uncharacterized protein n=1 Tax=Ceriporiopsis subvermispora (strain B) TaxID=914234 RepID=M2RAJ3_CERS8|nr:hypothetical protein CERSUDRAFT_110003 [Gelatoporia subvermispora B]
MAATPSKSKKTRTKPPRGRPQATSTISQLAVEDSSSLTYLSAFSHLGDLFAFLSLAIDKHRLRIYDTATGQSIAEHVVDAARVSSLAWARIDLSDGAKQTDYDDAGNQPKRKRKKRDSLAPQSSAAAATQVVLLGLSDGSLSLFSPSHGRVVRTLSHPSSTAAILSVTVDEAEKGASVWTSSADGTIRHWDASKGDILDAWSSDDRTAYSALAVRPSSSTEEEGRSSILAAHHSIRLLSMVSDAAGLSTSEAKKPKELASFTGHASSVRDLRWSGSSRFLSTAEADRFVYLWDVPEAASEGKVAASIPLDSDARSISLSASSSSQHPTLLTVSAGNKISIFPIPEEGTIPIPSKAKQKIATLEPKSVVSVSLKKDAEPAKVVAASFVAGEEGRIRVARLASGIQPVFEVVQYIDDSGDFIRDVTISHEPKATAGPADATIGAPNQRYNESSSLAVRSGVELGQDPALDDLRDIDGDLDVDLAELSLGQRLTALTGADGTAQPGSDEEEDAVRPTRTGGARKAEDAPAAVPASSLTRTLIQALHSSDARLLETCLAHSDAALIRNTVRRLPPQLAVPLITACVERLGRGARAANMKGGGAGRARSAARHSFAGSRPRSRHTAAIS